MPRISDRRYNLQIMVIMTIYVVLMLLVWPHARSATSTSWKVLLALSPVVPMTYVVWLMASRVMHSDELEQRVHLIALGVATALVGMASLVGGFLAAAKVWITDGSVLFWVFPALCLGYGLTRIVVHRRYTGTWGGCG